MENEKPGKKFQTPALKVVRVTEKDVVTTSVEEVPQEGELTPIVQINNPNE